MLKVLARNLVDKKPEAPLFARPNGKSWTQLEVNARLRAVKLAAAAHGEIVREHVTPYSFRHLYISELLMIGTPIFQVAKMAGTSLGEIERTYGHFFNRDLAVAQAKLDAVRKNRRRQSRATWRPERFQNDTALFQTQQSKVVLRRKLRWRLAMPIVMRDAISPTYEKP